MRKPHTQINPRPLTPKQLADLKEWQRENLLKITAIDSDLRDKGVRPAVFSLYARARA